MADPDVMAEVGGGLLETEVQHSASAVCSCPTSHVTRQASLSGTLPAGCRNWLRCSRGPIIIPPASVHPRCQRPGGIVCAGVSIVSSYKTNTGYKLSCLLQSYCRLSRTADKKERGGGGGKKKNPASYLSFSETDI